MVICAYNSLWQTAEPKSSIFTEEESHKKKLIYNLCNVNAYIILATAWTTKPCPI